MLARYRRIALYSALTLTVVLLMLDRTAAYLHRPGPASKSLRAYLEARGIPFTEHDVEKSFKGGMGFWALRGSGVPVSVIGPAIVHGYDIERIDESLARLGYGASTLQSSNRLAQSDPLLGHCSERARVGGGLAQAALHEFVSAIYATLQCITAESRSNPSLEAHARQKSWVGPRVCLGA